MDSPTLAADGSAGRDSRAPVRIDLDDPTDRWRYRCPNGHAGTSWSPTNSHLYCYGCRRQMDAGEAVTPEHYELLDTKTGEAIPWSAVEIAERDPGRG